MRAARSWATCCAASWRAAGIASRASTTSTTSGGQVRVLGASVAARARARRCPRRPIAGDYVETLAADAAGGRLGARRPRPAPTATRSSGAWASERIRAGIEASLAHLGVHFDVWKSEASLHDEGWVERAVERLRAARPRLRAGRRDLVPLDRLRRRQGPRHHRIERSSRPTSPPTSAMSPRSSAAASTTSSTSGAPTTTARWPASATPPRPWASTATRWRCCSSPGCASCATARRSR